MTTTPPQESETAGEKRQSSKQKSTRSSSRNSKKKSGNDADQKSASQSSANGKAGDHDANAQAKPRKKRQNRNQNQKQDQNGQPQKNQKQSQQQNQKKQDQDQNQRKHDQQKQDQAYTVTGILEWPGNTEGRVRQFDDGLVEANDDPFVPVNLGDEHSLRQGQAVKVRVIKKKPRRRKRNKPRTPRPVVDTILEIEGLPPDEYDKRKPFDELTPIDPEPRLTLEYKGCPPACRLIDLFCPIGYGTRGLIVAPPKAGKTVLLQQMAHGIKHNHPEVELVALLIDERPEEVTDFKRNVPAQVLASSNDQDLDRHLSLGILAIERAKSMVEAGKDVVVLLDSMTRLGRAFNNSRKYGSSGRTMTGGLDSKALEVPKQLFGSARNAEEGGSLTIIATCLVDTGSKADQIIFEEFKGTGNMELILDRSISERRLYPAINLAASGTRKEHLLMSPESVKTVTALRRRLMNMPPPQQIEQLLGALKRFETNEDLVRG